MKLISFNSTHFFFWFFSTGIYGSSAFSWPNFIDLDFICPRGVYGFISCVKWSSIISLCTTLELLSSSFLLFLLPWINLRNLFFLALFSVSYLSCSTNAILKSFAIREHSSSEGNSFELLKSSSESIKLWSFFNVGSLLKRSGRNP